MFTPGTSLEELEVTVAPKGEKPTRVATILVSPTRCYIDLLDPTAFQEALIQIVGAAEGPAQRRALVRQVLERWLTAPRQLAPKPVAEAGSKLLETPASGARH